MVDIIIVVFDVGSFFQNMKIFKHILNDIFAGLPDTPTVHQIPSARSRGFDVELVLKQKSVDKGLVAHDPWIERCKQLYNISKVHHGKGVGLIKCTCRSN